MNRKAKPSFYDNNAFYRLSEQGNYDRFMQVLSKSDVDSSKELIESMQSKSFIKDPITILEYFWIPQADINQGIEKKINSLSEEVKNRLAPYVKNFAKQKDAKAYQESLALGFKEVVDFLWDEICTFLQQDEELIQQSLFARITKVRDQIKSHSPLFEFQYQYAINSMSGDKKNELIGHIALEAICRYGTNLISRLCHHDRELYKSLWMTYIGHIYLAIITVRRLNFSPYRNINEQLSALNRKLSPQFFPTDLLRPNDDTLDSILTHFLAFGWFDSEGQLYSILALTEDPFDKVCSRVGQYQACLAYDQNMLRDNKHASLPAMDDLKPGTLFAMDKQGDGIQCTTFEPGFISEVNGSVQITNHRSDSEFIK